MNERGSAYIIAIFILMVLTLLAIGVVATSTTDLRISDNYARATRNLYAADAAANHAIAMLQDDPTAGNIAPYPTGTPLATGKLGLVDYSIWLWNQRIHGNGTTTTFSDTSSRQFRVSATDNRQASRRIEGIIEPTRDYPEALDYAMFSCFAVTLNGSGGGEVKGDIYAGGAVTMGVVNKGQVDVEAVGSITVPNSSKISGDATSGGSITLPANNDISGSCKASGSISKTCRHGTSPNLSPSPAKVYCNAAGIDWNPAMLSVSPGDLTDFYNATDPTDRKTLGWTVLTDITLTGKIYYVSGGNAYFNQDISYTGNNLIVVDGGSFICEDCNIGSGSTGSSTLSVITRSGDIIFRGDADVTGLRGVLWAGVVNADGSLPAAGSILVQNTSNVEVTGELVAVGGSIVNGRRLEVHKFSTKPPYFGQIVGYAITEWRELR